MAPNASRLLLLLAVLVAALLGGAYWMVSEPSGGEVSRHRWVPAPRHWRLGVPDGLDSLSGGGGKDSSGDATLNRFSAAAAAGGGGGGGPSRGGRLTVEVIPSTASSTASSDPVAAAIAAAVAAAEAGTASSAAATSAGVKPANASAAAPQPPQRAAEPTAASTAASKAALSLSPIVPAAPPPPQHQQQQQHQHQLLGSSLAPSGQAAFHSSNGNATITPEQSPPQQQPLPRPPPLPWCGAAMSTDDVAEYHLVVLASPRTHQGRYLAMTLLSVAASDARPTSLTVLWGKHDPAKKRSGGGGNSGDGGGGGDGIFSLLSDLAMYDNGVAALRGGSGGGGGAAPPLPPRPPFPHLRIRYLPDDVREGDITTAFYQTLRAPDQVAEEAGEPRLRELPLVVLEGDVLLAPSFGDRMSCLLRMMQGLGTKSGGGGGDGGGDGGAPDFAVSLYDSGMPSLAVPEAMKKYQASAVPHEPDEALPGSGSGSGGGSEAFTRLTLVPSAWSWGSQGLLFSYGIRLSYMWHVRELIAGCMPQDGLQDIELVRHMQRRHCAGLPSMPEQTVKPKVTGPACDPRVVHGNASAASPPPTSAPCYLYAVRPNLVQHVGASSALFGAVSSRFHLSTTFPRRVAIPGTDPDDTW